MAMGRVRRKVSITTLVGVTMDTKEKTVKKKDRARDNFAMAMGCVRRKVSITTLVGVMMDTKEKTVKKRELLLIFTWTRLQMNAQMMSTAENPMLD